MRLRNVSKKRHPIGPRGLLFVAALPAPAALALARAGGLLGWAVKMAAADGRVDPSERVRLDRFAAHDDISSSELDRIIGGALEGELQTAEPANPQEARDWLAAIARIGLSDGNVDRREIQLLQLLGSKANLSEYDTQLLLKRVRAEQYAAARSQVRF